MAKRTGRYVVLCLQGFGDALEATPLVEQLRSGAPEAEIVAVAMRPAVRDLFGALPELVDRVEYVPYWEKGALRAALSFAHLPFQLRCDASFLTYPSARMEYEVFGSAIPSARFFLHEYGRRRLPLLNIRRVPIAPKHNVLRNLDLLAAAGFAVQEPATYVVPAAWRGQRTFPNRVVLHIGSIAHHGLEAKRWPAASFRELALDLRGSGIDVALLAGPEEREATTALANAIGDVHVYSGTLAEMARSLSGVGAVVANDNGMAHLAAAVNTPVIALFGLTPVEHGPYGPLATIYRPSSCPPCFNIATTSTRCVRDIDYACLKRDIRAQDVADIVREVLRRQADVAADVVDARTPTR